MYDCQPKNGRKSLQLALKHAARVQLFAELVLHKNKEIEGKKEGRSGEQDAGAGRRSSATTHPVSESAEWASGAQHGAAATPPAKAAHNGTVL